MPSTSTPCLLTPPPLDCLLRQLVDLGVAHAPQHMPSQQGHAATTLTGGGFPGRNAHRQQAPLALALWALLVVGGNTTAPRV
eukprot:3630293-Rhodomonas_salina.1